MWVRCVVVLLSALIAGSCTSSSLLSEVTEVDPASWYSPAKVIFDVQDTISRMDLQLVLRYGNITPSDSVELMVKTTAPDGVSWCEHFTMTTPHGDSPIHVVESTYRQNIKWSQIGEYAITLYPQHPYQGFTAVGVNLTEKE